VSGLIGEERMEEPEDIMEFIRNDLAAGLPWNGKQVLLTADPTYEALDPVRFIGNHSTGLMGYELANKAADLGATVILISGPSHLSLEHMSVQLIKVTSAAEMYHEAHRFFKEMDVVICAAVVSDYRP